VKRFRRALLVFVALWVGASCLDISSPVTGIVAITGVIAPTPSVVRGDSLVDTLGLTDSLLVYAFGPNGDTVRDAVIRFISTDTTGKLRVDSISGKAFGAALSPSASVVARVSPANGRGFLETARLLLPVVAVPDTLVRGTNPSTFVIGFTSDTLSSSTPALTAVVRARDGTSIPSYLVSYEIIHEPVNGSAVLVDAGGKPSTLDTTDANGASRQLRIRMKALPDSILGGAIGNIVVRVRARYQGNPLPVIPADSFIVPFRVTF
jgi:hypothetical protein